MSNIKSLIGDAKRPERTVSVCLAPDLLAEWQQASERLAEAKDRKRTSLDDEGPVTLARQVADLEQRMRDATVLFRLRGLPPSRVRTLQASSDDDWGLALDVLRESLVEPELDDEDWERLFGEDGVLSMGALNQLAEASNAVNFRATSVPSSRLASAVLQSSDES